MDFRFHASALDGGKPQGEVEICGSNWIFPKPPVTQPLKADNVVHAGFWDTFFTVTVTAHGAIEIATPNRHANVSRWMIWAVVLIIVVAVVMTLVIAP
ncbi:MAG: hypothetical protein HC812_18045 [Leptolyngbya sp. RL_3_1]|nr:hypothetical protein [Leptolyngbya sp. RL_3_1]